MTKHLPEKKRRQEILEAARRLFVARGYGPTKMSDIATEAKLSKGGVYFHFVSKEEVFEALVEDEYERSMGFIQEIVGSTATVDGSMLASLAQHFYTRWQGENHIPRFFIVMGEMALRHEPLRLKLIEIQRRYWEAMAKVVERGIEAGIFRKVDPRAAGVVIKSLMDGLEAIAAFDKEKTMAEMDFAALFDAAMGGILKQK